MISEENSYFQRTDYLCGCNDFAGPDGVQRGDDDSDHVDEFGAAGRHVSYNGELPGG